MRFDVAVLSKYLNFKSGSVCSWDVREKLPAKKHAVPFSAMKFSIDFIVGKIFVISLEYISNAFVHCLYNWKNRLGFFDVFPD